MTISSLVNPGTSKYILYSSPFITSTVGTKSSGFVVMKPEESIET
jgi:hypothetical protein